MRILVKEAEAVIADLSFEDEQLAIGSDSSCPIHLPDARVSPRNVLISPAEDNHWRIESLDYSNPVTVNGHILRDQIELQNGDEIELHGYLLKVYLDPSLDHHVVEDPQLSADELARVKQFPLPAGSVVKRFFDPVTIGRGELERTSHMAVELATCRDIHELVDVTLRIILDAFNPRSAWVGFRRRTEGELEIVGGRLPSGQSCGGNPVIDLLQYRCIERAQHICVRKVRDTPEIGSAMAVPLPKGNGTLGMIYVDRRVHSKRFQIPDLDLLSMIGAQVASKLDRLIEQRAKFNAEISASEVGIIQSIQTLLDPKFALPFRNYKLAAYSRSGQESPGDVYDLMKHPDLNLGALMIGHVHGRGAVLAMSMARLHATFRACVLHNSPPHDLVRALKWMMREEKDPSMVDVLCLLMDPPSGRIKFCRAGKIGGFIVSTRGEPRALQGADAPAVGLGSTFDHPTRSDQLMPGETLALYSRGVATAMNRDGERFGERRFIQLVCDGYCQAPSTTMEDITQELNTFFADGRHPDDITVILLRRLPE